MLTDRDICLCASGHDEPLQDLQVSDALTWGPFVCNADDDLQKAEQILSDHQIRRLPVTAGNQGRLVGIVSLGDIARARGEAGTSHQRAIGARGPTLCHALRRRGLHDLAEESQGRAVGQPDLDEPPDQRRVGVDRHDVVLHRPARVP